MWVHSSSFKLVPFDSLDGVSYSPSMVTVAVSVAVCEIFSVKEWRDLENQVRGRSRSLKIIQTGTIQKLGCSFLFAFHSNYGAVSLTVYEIFSVK